MTSTRSPSAGLDTEGMFEVSTGTVGGGGCRNLADQIWRGWVPKNKKEINDDGVCGSDAENEGLSDKERKSQSAH